MSKLFRITALFALAALSACGPVANDCGPATCNGCCAGAECIQATNDRACGRGGLSCNACVLGDVCQNGVCLNPGFTGSGGGSSGVGGGFAMAGGTSSTGGGSTCLPRTCVGEQKNCGQISDGCGGMLDCGRCEISGETCGGSGTANRCGVGACTPTTCTAQGKNCGQIPDGCSNILECGICQGTQTCGGGGMANVCGNGCTPTTCAAQGKNCGQIPDGCGRMLPCGNCMGTQTCGGGGTQNVCGSTCTPTTCAAQGKNCGQIPDGCGLMLNCGSCQAPQTCAGAGTANVCGAACAGGCPAGFTCDAMGACSGGSLTNVVLDVPVPPRHTVTGVVRRNGAIPTLTGSCGSQTYYSRATITFTHTTDTRFNATVSVGNCTAVGDAFDFTASLYPGVYKVTISKPSSYLVDSNLPNWSTEVTTMFNVTGPAANVIFDVPVPPRHTVTGVVTRNGSIPTLTGSCGSQTYYSRATITFTHTTDSRFNATVSVGNCTAVGDAFDFTASLYPGTYRVTVTKPSSYLVDSNLPNWSTVVNAMFNVTAPASNVVFDVPVPPRHTVSGVVTRNGMIPALTGSCGSQTYYSRATISFTHTTDTRFNATVSVGNCTAVSDAFDFSASLYPGMYRVTVSKPSSYLVDSNLPNWSTEVTATFNVTGAASNVIFDVPVPPRHTVSGAVARNGMIPTLTGSCGSQTYYSRATIAFTHTTDTRFNTTVSVGNCTSTTEPFTFSALLYPGTYRVTISKPSSYLVDSNLPNWSTEVTSTFNVTGPASNVVFDVPVPPRHTVSGVVTRNGMLPTLTGSCGSQTYYSRATITFTHTTDTRFNATVSVGNCTAVGDAFDFTASLYPGLYRVTVSKPSSYLVDSNLPNWSTEVTTMFNVTAPASNVIFDVPVPPRHTVSGIVTRNGATPTLTGSCGSQTYYSRATITFTHLTDSRFNATVSVGNCTAVGDTFAFSALLYPGVYRVTVTKPSSYLVDSNLPNWSTEVVAALRVP